MDGVEILNSIEKTSKDTITLFIISSLFAIFFLALLVNALRLKERGYAVLLSIYTLACITLVVLCFFIPKTTTYQVTISEYVKFSEFQEKYKIIKQDGKIFTVEERKK